MPEFDIDGYKLDKQRGQMSDICLWIIGAL